MLCDSHIHIGQFYDIYTSPEELNEYLRRVGVDVVAVSSTTTCEGNYPKVKQEIQDFIEIFEGHVVPVLWVTPELLKDESILDTLLYCGIEWKCIKVHPQLSPEEWSPNSRNYEHVVSLAKTINVPILIHTGVVKNCHPYQISPLFSKYKKQLFIMAHGRPIEETIDVLIKCPNTLVDTAFMPTDYIQLLVEHGFADRILWGSDYPIIKFHERELDYYNYYLQELNQLKAKVNNIAFAKITQINMSNLYGIGQTGDNR